MHPILFVLAALGIRKLFISNFENNPELSEIDDENIYQDFLVEQDEDNLDMKVLKQKITRSLNLIIADYKRFKIGKSGNPKSRNSQHKKYKHMFILCSSSDEELISELESHYNSKYIEHKKNDNKKEGSAGRAEAYGELFYLYVVVRNK